MTQQPPPDPESGKPLDYYHSVTPAPVHSAVLAICTLGGIGVGIIAMVAAISVVGLGLFSASIGWEIGAVLLGVGFIVLLIRLFLRGRNLPPERRRTADRYFIIGFLIGCGLGCLLEGICFAALKNI